MILSGWGRYPYLDCVVRTPRTEADLQALVPQGPLIARGNGRGYGDCAMSADGTIDMARFNRILSFDPQTGSLVAEAGVILADVIDTFLPGGWFPWVTPGTKFVTLGGMIAADVHGKNHHTDGSLRNYIDWIDLLGADGEVLRCSKNENAELFEWTIGGMGLTGIILRLCMRMRSVESGWIAQRTLPAPNLETAMALFEDHADATYSVAWIDCLRRGDGLGRSSLVLGEHARADEIGERQASPYATTRRRLRKLPFDAPHALLNSFTVRAFNALYYRQAVAARGYSLVSWDAFFYPLDALLEWNRLYGRRGFAQFQCVLPMESAARGLKEMLRAISAAGEGSFLAVLKRMGGEMGPISFPLEGFTLALDFPITSHSLLLMERLDAITIDHGGRFYLAKDARMSAATLRASDPRFQDFTALRRRGGLTSFCSSLSERLKL